MAVVVVAGQARKVGKTSLVCGLIAAMPEMEWVAVKISPHSHGVGEGGDTARFLAAGAMQAGLVTGKGGAAGFVDSPPMASSACAMSGAPDFGGREILAGARNALIESNEVLDYLRADLVLAVVDPRISDFKDSLTRHLERVDAVVLPGGTEWVGDGLRVGVPRFFVHPPEFCSTELVKFVRDKLGANNEGAS